MKLMMVPIIFALSLLVTGCATVRSDVTAFHEWPSDLQEKTFVFEPPKTQDANLEYSSYQKLVAAELKRLGFIEASDAASPKLKVAIEYGSTLREVKIAQPVRVDPFWHHSAPYYFRWHRSGYRTYFYDPFWMNPPVYEYHQMDHTYYERQLRIKIAEAQGGKTLYETTVDNSGINESLAPVMPYMIRSAFTEFPGKSGQPHRVNLKIDD